VGFVVLTGSSAVTVLTGAGLGKTAGAGFGKTVAAERSSLPEFTGKAFLSTFTGIEGAEMLSCSSSRTESFIMVPQAGQIDKVGAKFRLQTWHFISFEKLFV
jgi:hypothetical protein